MPYITPTEESNLHQVIERRDATIARLRGLLKEAHDTIFKLSDAWVDQKDADALRKRIRRELSQVGSESEEE